MSTTNELTDQSKVDSSHGFFQDASKQFCTVAETARQTAVEYGSHYVTEPAKDIFGLLKDYASSRPEVAAAWCFGIGVFVGWKMCP